MGRTDDPSGAVESWWMSVLYMDYETRGPSAWSTGVSAGQGCGPHVDYVDQTVSRGRVLNDLGSYKNHSKINYYYIYMYVRFLKG